MVVIVDFGQMVRVFKDAEAAQHYFNRLAAKRREVWLLSRGAAKECGYL